MNNLSSNNDFLIVGYNKKYLKDKLTKIQYNLAEDTFNWTVKI